MQWKNITYITHRLTGTERKVLLSFGCNPFDRKTFLFNVVLYAIDQISGQSHPTDCRIYT